MRAMNLILTSLSLFVAIGCASGESNSDQGNGIAKNVSADEMQKMVAEKNDAVILDVRTEGELQGGWIPNAQNMDFYNTDFAESLGKLDKDKPVFVYCAAGGRSSKAMNMMKEMGFKEVYNLDGGFGAWQGKGLEVAK